ncbi:MAG TPA: hypothetical protein VFI05_06735 [Nitrospiraceae bacterium]|nr:hypothetical protein [Nitrospiraceae bacterium]
MSASQGEHATLLRELAALLIAVSGESVTVVKRSLPEQALKLNSQQEWKIYLEFLKVLFNMADRLAGFYLPLKDRPEFMDSLEDTVTQQLKSVLSPALGPDTDQMEVTITIGQAVSESRQVYERHAFMLTEESAAKAEYLRLFGERIAEAAQAPGNGLIVSAATLCANAAIPAMKAAFEGASHKPQTISAAPATGTEAVSQPPAGGSLGNEIKLVSVMSMLENEEVETRWGLHPRFRQDLTPDDMRELSRLMNRVTRILGERYAAVAFSPNWAPWQQVGHA